ncbi:MAG: ATP-binding protein, partial [Candidatus Sumerlaeota bacterium]
SRRLGKPIHFELEGEDITIDKKISEKIYEPIAHQIRNAMAHGIETEDERRRAGKDPMGRVTVRVRNLENMTAIEVIDDGRGIDPEMLREKVVEKGLVEADRARNLTADDLYDYLYLPGFSTAKSASNTAGRGVGMDVVRTTMNEIGGETRIQSEVGKGTVFAFLLPMVTAVNISDAFLVRAGNVCFAFPINSVIASQSVKVKDITTTTGKGRSIIYLGNILPLFDLMEVFGEPRIQPEEDGTHRVLILEHKKQQLAYVVSDFLSPQKIVITEFNGSMQVSGLSGTATLSGRKLGMVVDLPKMFEQTLGLENGIEQGRGLLSNAVQKLEESVASAKTAQPDTDEAEPDKTSSQDEEEDALAERPDSEFLEELGSMMSRLNRELLAFEENREKDRADSIFRLVHSIKGDFTMFGLERAASITHRLETLLSGVCQDQREATDRLFDALFDGAAYLEEIVKACSDGEALPTVPDKLKEVLEELIEPEQKPEAASVKVADLQDAQIELDPTGEFYLSSRRREGAPLFQCRIQFDSGDQPDFLVAYLILRRIQRVADVIGSLPRMADIEAGICVNAIAVLFSPRIPQPDLIENLGNNLKRYYGVSRFEATPFA